VGCGAHGDAVVLFEHTGIWGRFQGSRGRALGEMA
jgi:hypothetical protein